MEATYILYRLVLYSEEDNLHKTRMMIANITFKGSVVV